MKLSIMITSYNLVDYIDRAIESVIQQDKPFEWELLVGDDGSTDGTVEKIMEWVKKYPEQIFLYQRQRSGTLSKDGFRAAKNRAFLLERASGDFLCFLDGDDCLLGQDKFTRQVSVLSDPINNNCSCSAHNIIANSIKTGEKSIMGIEGLDNCVVKAKTYWKKYYFHPNTIMFRKECKELLLDEKYRDYLNDNFIMYAILQFGDIYFINQEWAQYNLTGEGLWTGKNPVYGRFRNIMLYDLEYQINKSFKLVSFIRHIGDFIFIFKNYTKELMPIVYSLLEGSEQSIFSTCFLLYKYPQTDCITKIRISTLKLKVYIMAVLTHLKIV